MDKIFIELVGGLGNQLFGVAAARFLEHKFGFDCEFVYPRLGSGNESHGISLNRMNVFGRQLRVRSAMFSEGLRLSVSSRTNGDFLNTYVEHKRGEITQIDSIRPGMLIRGYFQSSQAWEHLQEEGLLSSWPFHDYSPELAEKVSSYAFVHLRFGDYNQSHSHQIDRNLYYGMAIQRLLTDKPEIRGLVLVSDDAAFAGRLIQSLKIPNRSIDIVSVNPAEVNALDAIGLMSRFECGIISNSTFAFWGALLGSRDKYILYPDPWFDHPSLVFPEVNKNWTPISYLDPNSNP